MKHTQVRIVWALMGMLAMAGMLASCMAPSQQASTDEHAAEHRAYMAQLTQKANDIDSVLTDFQAAVGAEDVVAMKAAAAKTSAIVAEVSSVNAPEKLVETKESYVAGLTQLQEALDAYTQLYSDLSAGVLTDAAFQDRLRQVQESYDAGLEALQTADEHAVTLANE